MSDEKIILDLKEVSMIIEDGEKFIFDPRAEDAITKWIAFLKRVEEVKELVKERLRSEMESKKIVKIEGDSIKVSRRYFGERYELFDPQLALDQGMAQQVVKTTPDAKAIEQYAKETGELPEGVKLRDRTESVVIQEIGGDHE